MNRTFRDTQTSFTSCSMIYMGLVNEMRFMHLNGHSALINSIKLNDLIITIIIMTRLYLRYTAIEKAR